MKNNVTCLEESGLIDADALTDEQRHLIESVLSADEMSAMIAAGKRIAPNLHARARSAKVAL